MTDTPTLLTTDEVATEVGLNRHLIDRWQRNGWITATQPPTGIGSRAGYSPDQVATIAAIRAVRRDLAIIGLTLPGNVVADLWDQLTTTGTATLHSGTVTISVRIGLEDQ